ncbi:MAG: cytochrome c [Candidatus Eremiobacteraeota bacterium]|nr:cytochrome c [Candidatus Eremiobacteraeota bacterium]
MQTQHGDLGGDEVVSLSLFLDDATEPFATYRPPATLDIDTTTLADGAHTLRIQARDAIGVTGVRAIPFIVQNGPGITVTGLRANERVSGKFQLAVNAFSADEPFDPVRAESSGPIPVWTWVMSALIAAWAGWYGLTEFQQPVAFAQGNTGNAVAAANVPMGQNAPTKYSGRGAAAGFDYAATGPQLYATNCSTCHGASGAGVLGAFPALAADPVVRSKDPKAQIGIVLHGLHGRAITGKFYTSQMPAFSQLSDNDIAAIIDHERTSWGNNAPMINPDDVKRAR